MRPLTEDRIVSLTRTSLRDLVFLYLDDQSISSLTEALDKCVNLVTLSLAHNGLSSGLRAISKCSELWHLDLSRNQLTSLEGLEAFSHVWLSDEDVRFADASRYLRTVHSWLTDAAALSPAPGDS